MMLTEEQAKEKLCHLARPLVWVSDDLPENCRCIGSRCMAWRWHRKPGSANLWKLTEADRETIARHVPDLRIDGDNATQDGRGYCGLAGPVTP